jgi:hypothetical protein
VSTSTRTISPSTIPRAALILGLSGLLPFVVGAGMAAAGIEWRGLTGPALVRGYGVAILAFLGGAQWGASLHSREGEWVRYGYSVIPSLLAWAALLVNLRTGLGALVGGFAFVYVVDEWMRARHWLPMWYPRLRRWLTAVVLLCLGVTIGSLESAG